MVGMEVAGAFVSYDVVGKSDGVLEVEREGGVLIV